MEAWGRQNCNLTRAADTLGTALGNGYVQRGETSIKEEETATGKKKKKARTISRRFLNFKKQEELLDFVRNC